MKKEKSPHTKQEFGKPQRTGSRFACQTLAFLPSLTLTFMLIVLSSTNLFGQIQPPKTPTFGGQTTINPNQSYPTGQHPNSNNGQTIIQQQNRQAMRQMGYTPPPTQAEIQANINQQRQANYQQQISKQEQQLKMIHSIINEEKKASSPTKNYSYADYGKYHFSNHNSSPYKKHIMLYEKAFNEINKMLSGEKPLSVKDAVYYSESAFLAEGLPHEKYNQLVDHYKNLVQLIAKKYKLDLTNNIALQFAIQKLYNDTIYNPQTQEYIPPLTYDFEDIQGDKNYTQLFVSKLMATAKGQCHSMPLLHKILSDEFNGEAYLAYAPKHSYIRFKDDKGRFINFETTNGSLTTNSFVVGSGYIKSEAILNKIYTKEVDTRQLIAQLLAELATSFRHQLGYDDFIEQCAQTAIKYYPNSITAYMEKSNLETAKLDKALFNINYPSYEKLKEHPEEMKQLNLVSAMYSYIDKLGYSTMPKEAYEKWLKSLEEERQKQEDQKLRIQLNFNKFK